MHSDPATLLETTGVFCALAALAFWGGAQLLRLSPRATRCWAVANGVFALGTAFTVLRSGTQPSLLHPLGDSLELGGFAFLHAGLCIFLDRPSPRREHAALLGATIAVLCVAYAAGQPVVRLLAYCVAATWLLARSGWETLRGTREEFGSAVAATIAAPMLVGAVLQALRGVAGAFSPATGVTDSLQPTHVNMALAWAAFIVALTLDLSVAGLVIVRLLARINLLTRTDPLTGAMNRRAVAEVLGRLFLEQQRHGQPVSVACLDLDHFKSLNDQHGHAAGDAALRWVVDTLRQHIRSADAVGRLGGEEFCVLLPHTDLEGACRSAERLRAALAATRFEWEGRPLRLTASFGVASAQAMEGMSAEALFETADRALYAAKAQGRNRVVALPPEPHSAEAPPRLRLVTPGT